MTPNWIGSIGWPWRSTGRSPKLLELAPADLVLLNDRDLTYAKVRLDPVGLAKL